MSGLKRVRRYSQNVRFKKNQVQLINKASKITLKLGSVDGEVGMQISISGSISHVTEVKGGYQQEQDGRVPRSYPLPGGR